MKELQIHGKVLHDIFLMENCHLGKQKNMHRDAQGINSNTQMSKVLETIEKRHVTIFISRCPATLSLVVLLEQGFDLMCNS